MLGRATASPFPPTHKFNGQLLLELSGFAIGDSLTTSTSTQRDQKIEQQQTGAQLHNNYTSFIYTKLVSYPGESKRWTRYRVPRLYYAEWVGSQLHPFGREWGSLFDPVRSLVRIPVCAVLCQVLISAFALGSKCYLKAFSSLGGLALSARRPPFLLRARIQ